MSYNLGKGAIYRDEIEQCPNHPNVDVRHEWDEDTYLRGGYPMGSPISYNHRYFCTKCNRELYAKIRKMRQILRRDQERADVMTGECGHK